MNTVLQCKVYIAAEFQRVLSEWDIASEKRKAPWCADKPLQWFIGVCSNHV